VIEGVGDHGCEYMTRGTVVILGPTGKNFGAGMTGGVAYVLDQDSALKRNLNPELVLMEPITDESDAVLVKELIYKHLERTESELAKEILGDWAAFQQKFWKVRPIHVPSVQPVVAVPPAPLVEKATGVGGDK
jgi:glutamate synthase domain-containing protein 3